MSYIRYIHNISGGEKTYRGVPIADGAYYQIANANLSWYQTSDDIMADLTADDIRMSADGVTDFSTSSSQNIAFLMGTEPHPTDSENAQLMRAKMAPSGWHYQARGVDFETSVLASIVNDDHTGTDIADATIKFYDASDVELTVQGDLDTDCVKTVVDWEPTHDIEIVGGFISMTEDTTDDIYCYIIAVPDLTPAQGGSKPMVNGLNFKFIKGNDRLNVDGRTSKHLPYNATYHTSKLRCIMNHDAGVKCKFHIVYEHYKA